jgi:hypothetical protein
MSSVKIGYQTTTIGNYPARLFGKREYKLLESARDDHQQILETWDAPLVWSSVDQEGHLLALTAPAAGDEIAFRTTKHTFLAHIQSINGTPVQSFPYVSANGLELNTDDDATNGILGWEITNGILSTSKCAYTVGSFAVPEKKIFFEATINETDISDITKLFIGFRKAEAFQASIDDYDELAAIGVDDSANIDIITILNDGTTGTTDTTQNKTEGTAITLRVVVKNSGVVEFLIDGSTPTVVPAPFTFDSGEVIVPFLHFVADTGDPGAYVSAWRCGVL